MSLEWVLPLARHMPLPALVFRFLATSGSLRSRFRTPRALLSPACGCWLGQQSSGSRYLCEGTEQIFPGYKVVRKLFKCKAPIQIRNNMPLLTEDHTSEKVLSGPKVTTKGFCYKDYKFDGYGYWELWLGRYLLWLTDELGKLLFPGHTPAHGVSYFNNIDSQLFVSIR